MGTGTGSIDLSTLNNLHTNLTQHFWFNANAGAAYGTGVHMTLSSQAEFIANPTGQNILMNTDGISIRSGVAPLMVLDDNSLDFNVVADAEQGTYNNIATFGVVTRIGGNSEYSAVIEAGRFGIESGNGTILFNISPSGNPTSDIHAVSETTPMESKLSYILQNTPSNGTIIKCTYSYDARTGVGVPIGSGTMNFTAGTSSTQSKTERGTTVTITYTSPQTFSISASYSIGNLGMNAFSYYILDESVDLGILTFGSRQDGSTIGNNSATLGSNLIASHNYQTVVGKYNYDYDGAFVVGRGDSATRSNGLAVDWVGNIKVKNNIYTHCADNSDGSVYVGQRFEWSGEIRSNLSSNVDSYVQAKGSITIPGNHVYIIILYVSITNSTSGTTNRRLQLYDISSGVVPYSVRTESLFVAGQNWGTLSFSHIFATSYDATLTFRVASNRPTTTIPNGWIRAVCIA